MSLLDKLEEQLNESLNNKLLSDDIIQGTWEQQTAFKWEQLSVDNWEDWDN